MYCFVQLHIVSKRKDLTLEEALQTSDGMAVFGFFIEVTSGVLNWSGKQKRRKNKQTIFS